MQIWNRVAQLTVDCCEPRRAVSCMPRAIASRLVEQASHPASQQAAAILMWNYNKSVLSDAASWLTNLEVSNNDDDH